MNEVLASPWFWGFGGAVIYALPNLSVCYWNDGKIPRGKCVFDAVIALIIGPFAAAAGTGSAMIYLGLEPGAHLPAISAAIGLVANPLAPGAIDLLGGGILKRLQRLSKGDGT